MAERKSSVILELKNRVGGPLRQMKRQTRRETRQMRASFATLTGRARRMGVGVATAATAAGAAVATMTHQFATNARETGVWADRLGLSVRELSRLQAVGARFNVEAGAMQDGLKELSNRTDEYITNGAGPAAEALHRLGLSQDVVAEKSNDTAGLFKLVMDRLRQVDDAAKRQRIADELFGGQGAEQLVGMAAASADEIQRVEESVRRTGEVYDQQAAGSAKRYIRRWQEMKGTFRGVKRTVGIELLPVFSNLMGEFSRFIQGNRGEIAAWAQDFGRKLPDRIKSFTSAVKEAADGIRTVVDLLGGWKNAAGFIVAAPFVGPVLSLAGAFGKLASKIPAATRAMKGFAGANAAANASGTSGLLGGLLAGAGRKTLGATKWLGRGALAAGTAVGGMTTAAAGAAGAAGWGAGRLIDNTLLKGTELRNQIGKATAATLSPFSDEARNSMARMAEFEGRIRAMRGGEDSSSSTAAAASAPIPLRRAENPPAQQVGGLIRIEVDGEGRPRVRTVEQDGPVDFDVDAGPLMVGGG